MHFLPLPLLLLLRPKKCGFFMYEVVRPFPDPFELLWQISQKLDMLLVLFAGHENVPPVQTEVVNEGVLAVDPGIPQSPNLSTAFQDLECDNYGVVTVSETRVPPSKLVPKPRDDTPIGMPMNLDVMGDPNSVGDADDSVLIGNTLDFIDQWINHFEEYDRLETTHHYGDGRLQTTTHMKGIRTHPKVLGSC